ncbi:hypothetical protein PanWU01x14_091540 [Parasponia andersonii]|uniref:Uncharacterized protein n=1 Tax=Parasponia andersonii TaxID=3476 RepID=A0A2P5D746_PARAD|nr:hypothetical protein PanWU01x14_091540 [Parasponia andersonii]
MLFFEKEKKTLIKVAQQLTIYKFLCTRIVN